VNFQMVAGIAGVTLLFNRKTCTFTYTKAMCDLAGKVAYDPGSAVYLVLK